MKRDKLLGASSYVAVAGVGVLAVAALRRRYLRSGATDTEIGAILPGDDLLARVEFTATRAVTIR